MGLLPARLTLMPTEPHVILMIIMGRRGVRGIILPHFSPGSRRDFEEIFMTVLINTHLLGEIRIGTECRRTLIGDGGEGVRENKLLR